MAELKEELEDTNEPEARQLLVTRVRDELAKISDPRNFYDSVLIDEIQDYTPVEIELMASLSPRLYVVGDEQQRIFAASGAIQAALKAGCERKVITAHYRMGRAICEVADKLMPGSNLSGASYYDEKELPSEVRVHTGDQAAQLKQLAETLKLQIKTFPGQWFGVLAAKWATLEAAETYFDANGLEGLYKVQRGDEDRAYDPECPICIMTIQSAKGGEFRGVHLLSADIFPYFTREKAYTAITRAKTTLDVYHESNMAAPLQSALAKRRVPKLDLDEA